MQDRDTNGLEWTRPTIQAGEVVRPASFARARPPLCRWDELEVGMKSRTWRAGRQPGNENCVGCTTSWQIGKGATRNG